MPRAYRSLREFDNDLNDYYLNRGINRQQQQQLNTFKFVLFIILFYLFLQAENMRQLQLRNGHISAFGNQHKKFVLNNANPRVAARHKLDPPSNPDENPSGLKYKGIILHGVPKANLKFYRPDAETLKWTCINSPDTVIDWKQVNDNYCDCPDGSDEPGTSACKNGKFFCEEEHHFIPSNKVNDGICDCCDGADEWKGVDLRKDESKTIPLDAKLAPCKNECSKIKIERELEEDIYRQGKEMKETIYDKFIESNSNVIDVRGEVDINLLSPDHHKYLKLATSCYHYRSPSYLYELCPFRLAKQSDSNNKAYTLGKGFPNSNEDTKSFIKPENFKNHLSWETGKDTRNKIDPRIIDVMVMTNGDQCGDKSRTTKVHFICGTVDQIIYVNEEQTCVYKFEFTTPAAC